jgi:hypothetical protein
VSLEVPLRFLFGYHPAALRAYEVQHRRAHAFGEVWSVEHAYAFRELHHALVCTALGFHRGRTAWPLAVGTGKTQSLVAFALAQAEATARGEQPLSLLVCIERVDHGRDLFKQMTEAGVPAHMVGVYHRKTDREVAEDNLVPSVADPSAYPFLIATHAMMLKGEEFIATVNTYKGNERGLVVWDESLIKSQGRHLDLAEIEGATAVLKALVGDTTGDAHADAREAVEYVTRCTAQLREEFTRALTGTEPCTSGLPALTPEDETRFHVGIVEALKGDEPMRRGCRTRLVDFLEHAQRPVRVVPYNERGRRVGVVHYVTRIPESLSRLIVLDASHTIRRLTVEHDSTIRATSVNCKVKQFGNVSVRQLVQGAGRDKLHAELPRKDSTTVTRLLGVLKAVPEDEAVIIVTFKPDAREARKAKGHADHIKRHMASTGLDPGQKLADGRDRFVFLTWGQHIGTSDYAYCRHVLCVGVLRRGELDIASSIVGQRSDLLAPEAADPAEVAQTVLSEMFHNVIQAAGRGSCRSTINGAAEPMALTMLCVETFPLDWWQEAMPGVAVIEEKPSAQARAAVRSEKRKALAEALAQLAPDVDEVSARTLKVLAGLSHLRPDAYSRVLSKLVLPAGWRRDGRTFYRCPFDVAA